ASGTARITVVGVFRTGGAGPLFGGVPLFWSSHSVGSAELLRGFSSSPLRGRIEEGVATLREHFCANSLGVRPPREPCSRSSLYCSFHWLMIVLAVLRFVNQFSLRHSSRKRPLKLSTKQFCTGLPRWMNWGFT